MQHWRDDVELLQGLCIDWNLSFCVICSDVYFEQLLRLLQFPENVNFRLYGTTIPY